MTRAPQDRVTGSSFDYDAVNQVAVVNGDVEMTSGADRSATSDKATVDQQRRHDTADGQRRRHPGAQPVEGRAALCRTRDGPHAAIVARQPRARKRDASRRASIAAKRTLRRPPSEKVKQLADEAAAAAKGGAVSMFKTDPTAPIDVEAGRLDVDDRTKQAVFKSDVRAVQGDFIVRTSELRAYYTGAAGLAEESDAGRQEAARRDHAHRGARQGDRHLEERTERHRRLG